LILEVISRTTDFCIGDANGQVSPEKMSNFLAFYMHKIYISNMYFEEKENKLFNITRKCKLCPLPHKKDLDTALSMALLI